MPDRHQIRTKYFGGQALHNDKIFGGQIRVFCPSRRTVTNSVFKPVQAVLLDIAPRGFSLSFQRREERREAWKGKKRHSSNVLRPSKRSDARSDKDINYYCISNQFRFYKDFIRTGDKTPQCPNPHARSANKPSVISSARPDPTFFEAPDFVRPSLPLLIRNFDPMGMEGSGVDLQSAAQALFDQGHYGKLRNLIWVSVSLSGFLTPFRGRHHCIRKPFFVAPLRARDFLRVSPK